MQLKRVTALAAIAGSAAAQSMSICDKYTSALLMDNTAKNQYTLLTLLVNTAALGNFTGPGTSNSDLPGSMVTVPGILNPDGGLVKYFDGSLLSTNRGGKAVSVNFLDGGGAKPIIADPTSSGMDGSNQSALLMHLYQFFGVLLGCSGYDSMNFPAYAGDTNMASVHQFMDLDETEFTYFVQQVGLAAASFGASKADITTVANSLNMAFGMRCSPAASIVPGAPKEPQAMCIDSSCPEASNPDCGAYIMAMEPSPASMSPSAAMSTPMGSMTMPMGSSTPSPTPAPVSQISDGQPQATTPGPAYTGAAAAVAAPGALAGIAGVAAFFL